MIFWCKRCYDIYHLTPKCKHMKVYLSILIFLSAFAVSAQDFEIVEVTSQKWTAGTAKTGRGTDYKIKLVCKKRLWRLKFDKLWVNNDALPAVIATDLANKKCFSKKDTIIVNAVKKVKLDRYGDPIVQTTNNQTPPVKFDTPALLTYKLRKRDKSILIQQITKKKKVFHR